MNSPGVYVHSEMEINLKGPVIVYENWRLLVPPDDATTRTTSGTDVVTWNGLEDSVSPHILTLSQVP